MDPLHVAFKATSCLCALLQYKIRGRRTSELAKLGDGKLFFKAGCQCTHEVLTASEQSRLPSPYIIFKPMCSIEEIKIDTYACIEEKLHCHACTDYQVYKRKYTDIYDLK